MDLPALFTEMNLEKKVPPFQKCYVTSVLLQCGVLCAAGLVYLNKLPSEGPDWHDTITGGWPAEVNRLLAVMFSFRLSVFYLFIIHACS